VASWGNPRYKFQKPNANKRLNDEQKGFCIFRGASALHGGALQESDAITNRIRLPLREEMRFQR